MNGFTSADMSTAAANGHRDGYQAGYADAVKAFDAAQPAAAQEAVPAFYLHASDWADIRVPMTPFRHVSAYRHGFDHGDMKLVPFYAASPVAAAPVVPLKEQVEAAGYVLTHRSEYAVLKERADAKLSVRDEAVWFWQGDGYDFPESIGCPVVMPARVLREILASAPAAPGIDLPSDHLPVHVSCIADIEKVGTRCLDSGTCHHECKNRCFRRDGCVPLGIAGSYLNDNWTLKQTDASPKGDDTDQIGDLVEGMTVSIDVDRMFNTDGRRMFGTVTGVQHDGDEKCGLTLLVQDAEPNWDNSPKGGINGRATFQRWAVSQNLSTQRSELHIGMGGDYVDRATSWAWEAWQAAMQATSPKGVEHFQDRLAEIEGRPRPEPEVDEVEEVAACLGDDAAAMLDENPEDERALNMQRAAELLAAMQPTSAEAGS